jgi:hypothetical protein
MTKSAKDSTLFDLGTPPGRTHKLAARWFPRTSTELLERGYDFLGEGKCKGCGAAITWWATPNDKRIPIDYMATPTTPAVSHWATCTNPEYFRGAK